MIRIGLTFGLYSSNDVDFSEAPPSMNSYVYVDSLPTVNVDGLSIVAPTEQECLQLEPLIHPLYPSALVIGMSQLDCALGWSPIRSINADANSGADLALRASSMMAER